MHVAGDSQWWLRREITNSNLQIPTKLQDAISKFNTACRPSVARLRTESFWCLALGVWNFRRRRWLNILYEDSVELRNVSRVNIANASDEAIVKPGSAD